MEDPTGTKYREAENSSCLDLLARYHIPTDLWGKGSAKTVEHLQNEIDSGEAVLIEDPETGQLIRKFSFLAIEVLCKPDEDTYRLVEDRQVFSADGRVRRRGLEVSIGEKLKQGEDNIEDAAKRAIAEELGIQDGFVIDGGDHVQEEVNSSSYPGLRSHRDRFNIVVTLDSSQYRAEGYVEVQPDKTTYFVWKKV